MMITVKVVLAFIFLLLGSGVTGTWASPGRGGGFHREGFYGGGVIIDSPLFWWPSYLRLSLRLFVL
jgi:hypothetical protein